MGNTISEKILGRGAGKAVVPGDTVMITPDLAAFYGAVHNYDIPYFMSLKEIGVKGVCRPDKCIYTLDHHVIPSTETEAKMQKEVKRILNEQHVRLQERVGIGHQVLAEKGYVRPGMLVLHSDQHISILGALGAFATGVSQDLVAVFAMDEVWLKIPETIQFRINGDLANGVMARDLWQFVLADIGPDGASDKVMEYGGPTIDGMSIDERMSLCCHAMFAGATTAIINPDKKTVDYVRGRTKEPFEALTSDPDANYVKTYDYDVTTLEPQITVPPDVYYTKPLSDVADAEIDQASICSCASGRMDDLRIAAKILRKRKIHPRVRMIITPASQEIYLNATREGLIETFIEAGALVTHPTCDPCYGAMGHLLADETCITTATLNIPGRMGSNSAKIYLASSATVAASAVEGKIADPREYL
jgi:3-isopropylmalate/(R)-2-methylmalate dehydratase large subunit